MQALIKYLHSEEFAAAWNVFKASSEVEDIFEWTKKHGVNIDHEILQFSNEISEIRHVEAMHFLLRHRVVRRSIQKYSSRSFEDELRAQIKFEELNVLIDELLEGGNDFTQLYLILKVSRPALEKLFESAEIQLALASLTRLGVDIESLASATYDILRWN